LGWEGKKSDHFLDKTHARHASLSQVSPTGEKPGTVRNPQISKVRRRSRILSGEARKRGGNRKDEGAGDRHGTRTQTLELRIQKLGLNCRIWNTELEDRTEVTRDPGESQY
jgi:hypothetical protein